MKRSLIQRIILPRNWLFGRLHYINNNLRNILNNNADNFTKEEYVALSIASLNLSEILSNKGESSEKLKKKYGKSKNSSII